MKSAFFRHAGFKHSHSSRCFPDSLVLRSLFPKPVYIFMEKSSTIWAIHMKHFVNKDVKYQKVHFYPASGAILIIIFGVAIKRTDAYSWATDDSFCYCCENTMTQYNETPTKAPRGIHTAEQSGSVWRQPPSDVYVMLSACGKRVIILQTGSETSRCPATMEDVYIFKQYFLLGGYHAREI